MPQPLHIDLIFNNDDFWQRLESHTVPYLELKNFREDLTTAFDDMQAKIDRQKSIIWDLKSDIEILQDQAK